MFLTVANHNSLKITSGFKNYEIDFDDIPEVVLSGNIYCASRLKGDIRLDRNFEGNVSLLIIDVDDTCSISMAKELFKKFKFWLITTRSHNVIKNDVVCDRFRLFFKLDKNINDRKIIEDIYSLFISKYFFIDRSCRNVSRLFFPSPKDAIVFYNDGKLYPTYQLIYEEVEPTKPQPQPEPQQEYAPVSLGWLPMPDNVISGDNVQVDSREANLEGIQVFLNDNYTAGGRAICLFNASCMMKKDGFEDNEIIDYLLLEFNKRGGKNMNIALSNIRGGIKINS